MKVRLISLLNPIKIVKAISFYNKQKKYNRKQKDLELSFFSKILKNDMLHYGYFDDIDIPAESISIDLIEKAQIKYAELIIKQVTNKDDIVLDVGCGMGGLANMMLNSGLNVQGLTPNSNQIDYINDKYPELKCHKMKFEDFQSDEKIGTVINSESLQYINLDKAFEIVDKIINPDGRWIITDYFRINEKGSGKSGHNWDTFIKKVDEFGWQVSYQQDITKNTLPNLKFIHMYAERIVYPLLLFIDEKLRIKKAWLHFLTNDLRTALMGKFEKEVATINPDKFKDEKKYMLFVLQKK